MRLTPGPLLQELLALPAVLVLADRLKPRASPHPEEAPAGRFCRCAHLGLAYPVAENYRDAIGCLNAVFAGDCNGQNRRVLRIGNPQAPRLSDFVFGSNERPRAPHLRSFWINTRQISPPPHSVIDTGNKSIICPGAPVLRTSILG